MTTDIIVQAPEHYNPNQLVTYKVITAGEAMYPTSKVTDIEWQLENARNTDREAASLRISIRNLEESLSDWIQNETDADDIVAEICDMFGFTPTKTVEFEAMVSIRGTVTVPLAKIADFDIENVDLNIDVNSYSHDVDVSDVEVDHIVSL